MNKLLIQRDDIVNKWAMRIRSMALKNCDPHVKII